MLCAQGMQRGPSDYRTPMIVLIASNALNAVLEAVLVFGLHLGVPGSAWSTVIAQVLAAAAFAVVIRRHVAVARRKRPNWTEMRPLLSAGRSLLLRSGSMLAVVIGTTSLAARTDEPTSPRIRSPSASSPSSPLLSTPLPSPPRPSSPSNSEPETALAAADTGHRVVRLTIWCAGTVAVIVLACSPLIPRCSPPTAR